MALAAGANFIARCYAGDPNGTARVISEAVRHPGFSMVQVLSQCVTYQPGQKEWKTTVRKADVTTTSEAVRAARWLMADDGLSTGVLYIGRRPVYRRAAGDGVGGGSGSGVRRMTLHARSAGR
ncbi:MAG: hypothetical protein U1E35_05935 [Rhodospirillales bacterium]